MVGSIGKQLVTLAALATLGCAGGARVPSMGPSPERDTLAEQLFDETAVCFHDDCRCYAVEEDLPGRGRFVRRRPGVTDFFQVSGRGDALTVLGPAYENHATGARGAAGGMWQLRLLALFERGYFVQSRHPGRSEWLAPRILFTSYGTCLDARRADVLPFRPAGGIDRPPSIPALLARLRRDEQLWFETECRRHDVISDDRSDDARWLTTTPAGELVYPVRYEGDRNEIDIRGVTLDGERLLDEDRRRWTLAVITGDERSYLVDVGRVAGIYRHQPARIFRTEAECHRERELGTRVLTLHEQAVSGGGRSEAAHELQGRSAIPQLGQEPYVRSLAGPARVSVSAEREHAVEE